jgi:cell division protein FtsB
MRGKVLRWFAGVILIWVFWQMILAPGGLLQQHALAERNRELQGSLDSLRQMVREREVEISRLEHDTAYIEYIARTRLGMSRPEERVFRFVDRKPGSEGATKPTTGPAEKRRAPVVPVPSNDSAAADIPD